MQQKSAKNLQARFIKGIIGEDPILKEGRAHIVFAGRSNVGKSSTINKLLGSKLTRTSRTPGKTQELNFYLVGRDTYVVDLPGYGYAKMSIAAAEKMRKRIIWYLTQSNAPILA